MPVAKVSSYRRHVEKWSNCERCHLCSARDHVALFRGTIPCDVLFIGEGPGEAEDTLGKPFIGPAGKLLDSIIEQAWATLQPLHPDGWEPTYGLTNIVACLPLRNPETNKIGEPSAESIEACRPRLREIINLAQPKLIVQVGRLSEKWSPKATDLKVKSVSLIHPAAILKGDESQKGLAIKKAVVTLSDAVGEL